MSGTNTSWGAQEQNERIISALAWVIVVILLFYASVFVYKRFAASPGAAVTAGVTEPASPPATGGAVRTGVFPVASPRATPTPPPVTAQPTSRPVVTAAPTPTPSLPPPTVATRPTMPVVPTPTPAPTPTVAATPTAPSERMFTLLVGEFGSDGAAMAAARSIEGLSAYSFAPVRDPITGSTVLRVGRFSAPRDAQLAMASLRAGNPRIRILITPMADESALPPVRPPVTALPVPTPTVPIPPTPAPPVTRVPTAVPTEPPTRVVVPPTPTPTRVAVVPTPPPTRPAVPTEPPTVRPVPTAPATPTATRAPLRPLGEAPDLDMGPPAPPGWSIQIGSFSRPLNAVNLRKLAATGGLEAFVVEAESRGVMWYRVQVGTYGSQAAADAERAGLEERLGQPTIVVRRP